MKLIDANKVEKITWEEPSYNDPLNILTEVRDKIRALPTVDAIPVEWIHKYAKKLNTADSMVLIDMEEAWAERKEE